MITIYFEAHSTTLDNEAGIASGHSDVALSESGREQAAGEKAQRYADIDLDVVFTSDTRRAYDTAKIMLSTIDKGVLIIKDARLRECDYGDLTRRPRSEMEAVRAQSIYKPFPNGESYEHVVRRMREFLDDLRANHDSKSILMIGHYATHMGLEYVINGVPLEKIFDLPPRFSVKYNLS